MSRAAVAFGLMLLPATAMGATLPLLTRALAPHSPRFGIALGRLYGWNTLGGVAGAIASETLLVPRLGLTRTAFVAAALNLAAVVVALALDRSLGAAAAVPVAPAEAVPSAATASRSRLARLLASAFLAGGILLALEVVWFRFLELFVFGTQLAFALMLATVLAGIALGGLVAAAWLRQRAEAARALVVLALLAGVATVTSYAGFEPAHAPWAGEAGRTLWLALVLMLPTSLVSGVLFTLLGAAIRDEVMGDAAAAGWLTLANTVGAALGAPLAGLVLLPVLGVERSLFALAAGYALLALAVLPWSRGLPRPALFAAGGVALLVMLLFPFGLMQGRFLRSLVAAMAGDGAHVVAFREGPTETAILLQTDWGGAPVYQQLVTNAHSMTSSIFYGRRYMKLFAYWPLALRPQARRALLISYGLGNTAEALVRAPGLERIDVVDTSRTILALSPLAARGGAGDPLGDPRVRVHVEDGRFFMRAGGAGYDIITAEPPPPHAAGIASLYSLEYFRLTRSRLAPGGIATHWLPVNQLPLAGARAVVRAFCEAFEDCSLWTGAGYDWILAGTNGAAAPSESDFARPWAEAGTGGDLREIGVESSRAARGAVPRRRRAARGVGGGCFAARRRPAGPPGPRRGGTPGRRGLPRAAAAAGVRGALPLEQRRAAAVAARRARADVRLVRLAGRLQPRLRGGRATGGARRAVGGPGEDAARDAAAAAARQRAPDPRDRAQPPRRGRSSPRARLPPRGRRAGRPRLRGRRPLLRRGARGGQRLPLAAPAARPRPGAGRPPRRGAGGGAGRAGRRGTGPRPPVAFVAIERLANGAGAIGGGRPGP